MAKKPQSVTNGNLLVPSKVWDQLTTQERKLVDVYLTTGDEALALRAGGFDVSDKHRVFHDQVIVSAMFYELTSRIYRGAIVAQVVLEAAALNEKATLSTRIDAAKALRAPFLERNLKVSGMEKPLTEHTIEELRALVETLENQRSKDAKVIDAAPAPEPASDNPLDLLG